MNTSPKWHSVAELSGVQVVVQQPLAILLENGPAFSVLISPRVSSEPDDGQILLEDSCQFRIESDGRSKVQRFSRVQLTQDSKSMIWMASPDNFVSLFSQPSYDPYAVLELMEEESILIDEALSKPTDTSQLFVLFRKRFGALPRFYSPSRTELRAPT